MIVIRDEQRKVFEDAALRAFEDEMVEHLKEFTPNHCAILKEAGVRQVIRLGLERAKRHGLTNRGPVRFYIELMFMFGSDFDTDPMLPWVPPALDDPALLDQMLRAERLHAVTMDYLRQVAGPDNEYAIEALRRISRVRPEGYPAPAAGDFETTAVEGLKAIYPQRCQFVGEPALRDLVRRSTALARRHEATTDLGLAVFIALMFSLGHGFTTDPLYPWIAAVLNNPLVTDPVKRIERLHANTRTYLDATLANLERR
jgi:hypothetical protein